VTTPSRTRLFALLGNPVSHSLSPRFQNAGFRAAGINAHYSAIACTAEQLPVLMCALTANGGGGNVTVPYKEDCIPHGIASARVHLLGAANTFMASDPHIQLENTDVDGVLHAITHLGAPATRWLVVGTGGSARAVIGAALESGASVAILSRAVETAQSFSAWATRLGVALCEPSDCDVAINATPLGMRSGDGLPLTPAAFPRLRFALDLVYRSEGPTLWVDTCRAAGLVAADGREMLIAQGAASWRLWFPDRVAPFEILRAALRGRLD
jgi:shikimate dehydrogenase